ncbi:response regulator [Paenibacillus pinisoli]|uniref:Response regulator n=1 Tax=Paenibacillus pinisoli TaxID=1276110 RepID=A0A3A6PSU0_9BACL|nr:response regulator [Paenibacillus pinisoli]RJX41339.1 response regulator [Paenibacillus pinisoli]
MYRVLIVEDEDIIRKGLTYKVDWLNNNCVVVGSAIDGNDGLEQIKKLKPDIVITDIRMPFKDGIIMLEEALAVHDFETIIISGYSEFDYAQKAISLGVSEYILKPIDFRLLDIAIQKTSKKIDARQHEEKKHEFLHRYQEVLDVEALSVHSTYVSAMLDYIKGNYPHRVSITDLSEKLQVSTVYLNAKFKDETNYTFNDFLNRYRIIKAIDFMENSGKLIYEIAELVGFKEYKYFSQVFKKYVGYSPTHFTK